MRDYFLKAGEIARPTSFWEDAIVGTPNSISFTSDFSDPFEMIEAFAEAHQKKARLDSSTLSAVRRQLASSDGALSNNPRAGRLVLDMMKDRKGIYNTLLAMHEVGLLGDFSDDDVIQQFADMVGNIENLRMLCLLTYADMKAVNNEVVTPWKEDLLWQLYVETYNHLMLGLADDQYTQQPALERDIEE